MEKKHKIYCGIALFLFFVLLWNSCGGSNFISEPLNKDDVENIKSAGDIEDIEERIVKHIDDVDNYKGTVKGINPFYDYEIDYGKKEWTFLSSSQKFPEGEEKSAYAIGYLFAYEILGFIDDVYFGKDADNMNKMTVSELGDGKYEFYGQFVRLRTSEFDLYSEDKYEIWSFWINIQYVNDKKWTCDYFKFYRHVVGGDWKAYAVEPMLDSR